jgi:hypothetical protein
MRFHTHSKHFVLGLTGLALVTVVNVFLLRDSNRRVACTASSLPALLHCDVTALEQVEIGRMNLLCAVAGSEALILSAALEHSKRRTQGEDGEGERVKG